MTKNAPATPLPWADPRTIAATWSIWAGEVQVAACRVVDDKGAVVPYMVNHDGDAQKNAAYIAHACNSYPLLVEALRESVRAYDSTGGAKGLAHQTAAEGARFLLRSLGEE